MCRLSLSGWYWNSNRSRRQLNRYPVYLVYILTVPLCVLTTSFVKYMHAQPQRCMERRKLGALGEQTLVAGCQCFRGKMILKASAIRCRDLYE
jgi:hypothetical protein